MSTAPRMTDPCRPSPVCQPHKQCIIKPSSLLFPNKCQKGIRQLTGSETWNQSNGDVGKTVSQKVKEGFCIIMMITVDVISYECKNRFVTHSIAIEIERRGVRPSNFYVYKYLKSLHLNVLHGLKRVRAFQTCFE